MALLASHKHSISTTTKAPPQLFGRSSKPSSERTLEISKPLLTISGANLERISNTN